MMNMKAPVEDKGWGRVQIGISSLVLIFTVLCLVVFSTLSIASAKSDQNLALKNQQYVMDYYAGDAKAEELLKEINEKLMEFEATESGKREFPLLAKQEFGDDYQLESNLLTYKVDLNKEQFLLVELKLLNTEATQESNKKYIIKKWVVKNNVDYEIYDDLPVWDGSNF
jgi:hypothetical protein